MKNIVVLFLLLPVFSFAQLITSLGIKTGVNFPNQYSKILKPSFLSKDLKKRTYILGISARKKINADLNLGIEVFYEERGWQQGDYVLDTALLVIVPGNKNFIYSFLTFPFLIEYNRSFKKIKIGTNFGANISYRLGGTIKTPSGTIGTTTSLIRPDYHSPTIDYGMLGSIYTNIPLSSQFQLNIEFRHYQSFNGIGSTPIEKTFKHLGNILSFSLLYVFEKEK
ncbi:MAG: hypothetical protein RLZZ292_1036 [Bacteroidota bacterium]|jgi:hypothetical protein